MKITTLQYSIKYYVLRIKGKIKTIKLFSSYNSLMSSKGFTLVELMVVFSISAILAIGVGVGSYSTYNKIQQFEQSASNAVQLLSQARSNSISSVKIVRNSSGVPISCGTNKLNGYTISSPSNKIFRLFIRCESLSNQLVKELVFPGTVEIGTPADGTTCPATGVVYETLTANVTSIPLPCDYILKDGTRTKTVHIERSGIISLQ